MTFQLHQMKTRFQIKSQTLELQVGFLPNVNAGADDAAVEAGLLSVNPKENGDDAVDAVRGDGEGFVAFFAGFVGVFSSSSIRSWTFF